MEHSIYRVTQFEIVGPYRLRLVFSDGMEQVIDFQPVLAGELFGPLQDIHLFNQVEIDPEAHTLVWPNGADFDAETLHDWPKYAESMKALAKQWASRRRTRAQVAASQVRAAAQAKGASKVSSQ